MPEAVGLRASGARHRIPGERVTEAESARGRGPPEPGTSDDRTGALASASKDTDLGTRGDSRGPWRPGRVSSVM